MESALSFGQWLKRRRHELDLTQEAVAHAVGCSSDMIRKIESGKRRPSRQIAELLLDLLEAGPQERPAIIQWARGAEQAKPSPSATQEVAAAPMPAGSYSLPGSRGAHLPPLPGLSTQLIGREPELARIKALLWRSSTRLLTLVGPPGIGKTSLGIALSRAVQADFKDGLVYISLAPIADASLVAATLAEGLGARETPSRTLLTSLQAFLLDKQMLLVLDNFEHVVAAAPLLTDLLAAAPQVKILVTSRSPLHLRGEKLIEVSPLGVPDFSLAETGPGPDERQTSLDDLARTASVALFVERVRDVNSNFALTTENAPLVAAICARLDGLPLAIELAAARTRILSLSALFSRLERQLAVLAGGPRDAPVRHQALRDALDSSYKLLGEEEQRLFRQLGIFPSSFTFEAAEEVCGATLAQLEAILDQSLLRSGLPMESGDGSDRRYAMLVPVREFALEQLDAAGEHYDTALRHACYFLDMLVSTESEMRGPHQKVWLDRTNEAYSDLRAALNWTLQNNQPEIALRLSGAVRLFWQYRGYRQEGLRWLERALAQGGDLPAGDKVAALLGLGALSYRNGEQAAAERYYTGAIELSREAGDKLLLSYSLVALGQLLTDEGEFERAVQSLQEGQSISQEVDDKFNIGRALSGLGRVMSRRREYAQAIEWYEKALVIRRQVGVPAEIAQNLENLGALALKQGDFQRAIAYTEESVPIDTELGNKENLTYALGLAGKAALGLGDYERAAANFRRCLSTFVELGATPMVAFVLEEIARVDIKLGQPAKAARLFGVAEALRESVGAAVDGPDRAERDETIATLRELLSDAQFGAAWAVGRVMPLEDAITYAKAPSRGAEDT